MRIVICGAGEVGRHAAVMLAGEEQEVILMDENSNALADLDALYDLMTKVGSPISIKDLTDCGVKGACFVAVTPDESTNITACILANSLGASKTMARINNYEYMLPENKERFKQLGIDSLLYPEILAATEIIQALQRGWMREYYDFGDEALRLVCIKIRGNASLLNKPFKTGYFDHPKYRIVAIKRNTKTIIPSGDDEVMENDLVYFICPKDNLEIIRQEAGKKQKDIHHVMIMGGSRIALKTAHILPPNIKIKIIEIDRKRCHLLAEKLPNALIIHGDGRNVDLLKQEGIADMDAFVAVTAHSEANVFSCMAAKQFGVGKTIAEVENLDYIDLAESLDIGTIINKKLIAASHIYQYMLDDDALDVFCLTFSDAQVVVFIVKEGDKITRQIVRNLRLPKNVNIGGIIRDNKGFVVNGDTQILPGDQVVVFCMASGLRKTAKFFQ